MDRCDTTPLLGYDDALTRLTENIQSRAAVVEMPLLQALGAILASDGSFAFTDSIKLAGEAGIKLIVSPKGSKNENEIINECNKQKIKLVFTNTRVFKH